MELRPIYHHTGLEKSGGATRVARIILGTLGRQGVETNLSFELAEKTDGSAVLPEDFGRYLPAQAIAHIHCTGNWPRLLNSIPSVRRTVITLHDCELFTGGCPYPLDCTNVDAACADPCPRNFPDSAALRKAKLEEVQRLSPTLVAPSRWLARLAKTHLHQSVSIIPNGIPWPGRLMPKSEARRQLGINPSARVGLFAAHGGMSAAYKSGDQWKDIWTALKARMPELLCFAVGGDKAGRQDDLVIWPYVQRSRLILLMSAADVLLYPTRADNHSMVILEAMSRALPVVSYKVGGVPEQVLDQRTGLLVPPGNQEAFVDTAHRLLSDPGMIRDMGREGYASGRKRFNKGRMVSDYIKLYRSLD